MGHTHIHTKSPSEGSGTTALPKSQPLSILLDMAGTWHDEEDSAGFGAALLSGSPLVSPSNGHTPSMVASGMFRLALTRFVYYHGWH